VRSSAPSNPRKKIATTSNEALWLLYDTCGEEGAWTYDHLPVGHAHEASHCCGAVC
jgi:hypothetical protein